MSERKFISYETAELLIIDVDGRSSDNIPGMSDQMESAVKETIAILAATAASGEFHGEYTDNAPLLKPSRVIAAMMMHSATPFIEFACEHANWSPRPLMFSCDPPFVCCKECFDVAMVREFRWNNQCDACGSHVLYMVPVLVNIGPIMIHGHLCDSCSKKSRE